MTNSFLVAVFVLWGTNKMDTLLTPSGDEILRSIITVQTHVYTIPGQVTVTNKEVPVLTNSVHLKMTWVEVPAPVSAQLPPVPEYIATNSVLRAPRTQVRP